MKLYVKSKKTGEKIPLSVKAKDKNDLINQLGTETFSFKDDDELFTINDVVAELDGGNKEVSTVIGAVLGLLGGGIGVLAGAAAGAFLGIKSEEKEQLEVEHFNNSKLYY